MWEWDYSVVSKIMCSLEGGYSLFQSLGEHYAKCNQPGCERQIPGDLTHKRILIHKTNEQAKI